MLARIQARLLLMAIGILLLTLFSGMAAERIGSSAGAISRAAFVFRNGDVPVLLSTEVLSLAAIDVLNVAACCAGIIVGFWLWRGRSSFITTLVERITS